MKPIIFTTLIILHLISTLLNLEILTPFISVLSLTTILLSIPSCSPLARSLAILFIVLGSWMVWNRIDLYSYLISYGGMLNLLSLFAMIPLLALPIKLGGYSYAIESVLQQRVHSSPQLYRMISGLAFFLSSFLNLATLPMLYHSVKDSVQLFGIQDAKRFTSLGIIHGYALPILWTPVAPIVGVVLDLTKVKWLQIFPILFGFSILALLLDWFMQSITRKKKDSRLSSPQRNNESEKEEVQFPLKGKLLQIGFAISLFISLIIISDHYLSLGLVTIVTLFAFPFAVLWSAFIGQEKEFFMEIKQHVARKIPNMAEQFAIFLSAGFFVKALKLSGNSQYINEALLHVEKYVGVSLFLVVLPLIPLFFSYVGMHPAVAITLLAETLDPTVLPITPEGLSFALLGGAVATFIMGPFNATLGVMSSIVKETPFRLSYWNWPYTVCFIFLLLTVLWIVY